MGRIREPFLILRRALPDMPRTRAIAKRLGMHPHGVCGFLGFTWEWAGRMAKGEFVPGATAETVDDYSGLPGLAEAMVAAGWLVLTPDGATFPNLREWNYDPAASQTPEAERQRKARAARGRKACGSRENVTVRDQSVTNVTERDQDVTVRDQSVTPSYRDLEREGDKEKPPQPPKGGGEGGETAREETPAKAKKQKPPPAAVPGELPAGLDTPAFRSALSRWIDHRAEKKKPATPTAVGRLVSRCEGWGEARAVAAIDYSVAQGWDGVFEERDAGTPPARASPARAATREEFLAAFRGEV